MNSKPAYCSKFNLDSSETVAYNNPLFPAYIAYGFLSSYPDYSAISHWHRDLEFILIQRGAMTYNVDGELVELTEGNGIMVNSRRLHYGFSAEHSECEFICILLSPELLQGNKWFYEHYIEQITGDPSCPYLYLDRNGWQASILEKLEQIYRSCRAVSTEPSSASCCIAAAEPAYFELIENFTFIMRVLYQNFDRKDRVRTGEASGLASLRSMIAYMEEHYAEHLALADIALSGACCKSRCSLLFKKYLHDTPVTWLTKLRLRKSLTALLESDKSITDIAYEHGFGGASYYCETFKRYYGIPPLAYKRLAVRTL